MNEAHELAKALEHLPHGEEFRFVDRLNALDPGRSGAGEYLIRGTEPFLRGHFPGDPMFPGVLLVEAVAQLAGVVAQAAPTCPPMQGLKLTALRAVKILGTGRPGDLIELTVEISGRLGDLIQARGSARVGEVTVLQADITLSGAATGPSDTQSG